jgi:hypothetical protein
MSYPYITVAISSKGPVEGDVTFQLVDPVITNAADPQPTDAELIDIGNRLLASDYVQNRPWGDAASIDWIGRPAIHGVYPTS